MLTTTIVWNKTSEVQPADEERVMVASATGRVYAQPAYWNEREKRFQSANGRCIFLKPYWASVSNLRIDGGEMYPCPGRLIGGGPRKLECKQSPNSSFAPCPTCGGRGELFREKPDGVTITGHFTAVPSDVPQTEDERGRDRPRP